MIAMVGQVSFSVAPESLKHKKSSQNTITLNLYVIVFGPGSHFSGYRYRHMLKTFFFYCAASVAALMSIFGVEAKTNQKQDMKNNRKCLNLVKLSQRRRP